MLDLLQVEQTNDVSLLCNQFIQHCYATEQSESTIRTRRTHLKHFNEFCVSNKIALEGINNIVADAFFIEYSKGFPHYRKQRNRSTVNASRRILKVFFRWVEGYKEMSVRVKPEAIRYAREPKKLPKAIDRDVILSVIDSTEDYHDALMIETMWRAGLRISELVALTESDINGDELLIHGKGAVERKVYVTDTLAKQLNDLKIGDAERSIFRNTARKNRVNSGEAISLKAARLHIQRCFKKSGITMHPHQLRHSFAVELLVKGCDIVSIQKMMGHEDITTTQVYLRLFDDQVKKQYKKFMV